MSARVVLVMGVTGVGKTTVGRLLAERLGWRFHDADDFHPPANLDKLRRGVPLTDDDRRPWLRQLRQAIRRWIEEGQAVVLACSALKRAYRETLTDGLEDRIGVVYLKGDLGLVRRRLAGRESHFMHPDLLPSQFADLEEPDGALEIDAGDEPGRIVARIVSSFGL